MWSPLCWIKQKRNFPHFSWVIISPQWLCAVVIAGGKFQKQGGTAMLFAPREGREVKLGKWIPICVRLSFMLLRRKQSVTFLEIKLIFSHSGYKLRFYSSHFSFIYRIWNKNIMGGVLFLNFFEIYLFYLKLKTPNFHNRHRFF